MTNLWQVPPFLTPGDKVTVIAPSGALKEIQAFQQGLEIWRSRGYQIEMSSNCQTRYGYLAGTDEQRREGLAKAWQDRECKAIICARGGYGSARLLENWHWQLNSNNPVKWLIGFSDVTALLWCLAKAKISSLHAPVLTTLASEPEWSITRLFNYLETGELAPLQGKGWGGGKAEGRLLPANLAVATNILGTPLQPALEGVILALEDVGEAPYRVDRMLTQWRLLGLFKNIKGIAIGRFSQCEPTPGAWQVKEVLRDRLQDLNIPIVSDLPFGHDGVNAVLPVGKQVTLDGDLGLLS